MKKARIVKVNDDDRDVILAGYLNFEETAEILDILKKVKGLEFDFHRNIRFGKEKEKELSLFIQKAYADYISRNLNIPKKSIERTSTFGSPFQEMYGHPLKVLYTFSKEMSGKDAVSSGFESGYVRVKNADYPIVSLKSHVFFNQKIRRYECRLHNVSSTAKRLYTLLEKKLAEPELAEDLSCDF
ncbi:MAG TPA: hypothetical protein VJ208_03335 [Candidatus Nanoarchaeia archaeon]|nr:hypothetical protein [Candidatus Nanoarchaeia archaeon]